MWNNFIPSIFFPTFLQVKLKFNPIFVLVFSLLLLQRILDLHFHFVKEKQTFENKKCHMINLVVFEVHQVNKIQCKRNVHLEKYFVGNNIQNYYIYGKLTYHFWAKSFHFTNLNWYHSYTFYFFVCKRSKCQYKMFINRDN